MPTLDPLIGRRLGGKYEITGLIGRGGFGAVYRAIQAPVNRIVAVKVIASKQVDDSGLNLKERFFREATENCPPIVTGKHSPLIEPKLGLQRVG